MKQAHFILAGGDQPNHGILNIEGDLTIETAENVRQQLLDAIKQYQILDIDVKNVASFDLSFLQLIFSAHNTAIKETRNIFVKMDLPAETNNLLKSAGFNPDKLF